MTPSSIIQVTSNQNNFSVPQIRLRSGTVVRPRESKEHSSSFRLDSNLPSELTLLSETESIPQIDGTVDESPRVVKPTSRDDLIQSYQRWSRSKFGRVQFTITSDDGLKITSDDLDQAWSSVVDRVRACRDEMNLTHLPMGNDELNGHQIFGLFKSTVKTMLHRMYTLSTSSSDEERNVILPLSASTPSQLAKKKVSRKKPALWSSRLTVYQRKHSRRQRFGWLENPHRKIEYAMKSFVIDDALAHVR